MQHKFYIKTEKQQYQIQLLIGFAAFLAILLSFIVSRITGLYVIVILFSSIVLSIIAPFLDTPSQKKSGKLIYHSLLFISEKQKNGIIKIHGGTLFDYVFVLDKKMNGKQRTNFILQQYLQGLLNLIEANGSDTSDPIIRGTSYIINQRTAERIGFRIINTDMIQKIILIYNYFNVLITYSIAKNKLSFPKLSATKTFEINMHELIKRKTYIEALNEKLKRTLAENVDTK